MTTTEIQTWQVTQPAREGQRCVHLVWHGQKHDDCGEPAAWIVDYTSFHPMLGHRPHCEHHTSERIEQWKVLFAGRKR